MGYLSVPRLIQQLNITLLLQLLQLAAEAASRAAGAGCTYPGKHTHSVGLPVL
jgi:hypothetical protein